MSRIIFLVHKPKDDIIAAKLQTIIERLFTVLDYLEQCLNNLVNTFKHASHGTANEILRKQIFMHIRKIIGM